MHQINQTASLLPIMSSLTCINEHKAGIKVGYVDAVNGTLEDVTSWILISDDSCRSTGP
jgi:hypothetical protein